jgi:putative DNA primase/helicase
MYLMEENKEMKNENQLPDSDVSLNNENLLGSVLSKFTVTKSSKGKYQAKCPAHDDGTASLTITEESDGKILLHCHAGCDTKSILDAVGLDFKALFPEKKKKKSPRELIAQYDYQDEKGNLAHATFRYLENGKKKFVQCAYVDGKKVWKLKDIKLYPYNLPAVLKANPDYDDIYIVEGEKDADNLIKRGIIATTSPMGAGKWKESYNQYFKNQNIVVIPDNDEAGKKHARDIIANLKDVAFSIKLINLPNLKEKQDVSDWLMLNTTEDLKTLVANTRTFDEQIKADTILKERIKEVRETDITEIQEYIYTEDNKLIPINVLLSLAERYQICTSNIKNKRRYFIYKDGYWQDLTADEVAHLFVGWLRPTTLRASTIENVTKLMHSIPQFNVPELRFNSIPHLVNLNNCAFNLNTFLPEPHFHEHYFTYKTDYDYDLNADCPNFRESLKIYATKKDGKMINGWIDSFYEIAGYCLRGDYPFQKMFWFTGSKGRNGKGTCVRIIENLVGHQYTVSDIDPRDLRERFYKTRLMGKRLATSGDLHNRLANVATLKQLTGGDKQTSDVKFGDAITFTNVAKLIFAMNQLPTLPEGENIIPIAKRIVVLPFEAEISKPDAGIEDKFQKELSGIFNQAVEGLKRLMKNREFTITDRGELILDMYSKKIPMIDAFIIENLTINDGENSGVFQWQVFQRYMSFMFENYGGDHWQKDITVEIKNRYNLRDYIQNYFATNGIYLKSVIKYCKDKGGSQSYIPRLVLLDTIKYDNDF